MEKLKLIWNTWKTIIFSVSAALPLISGIYWLSTNLVFASDFNVYQKNQEVRWLMYDSDKLWREYSQLRMKHTRTSTEELRMLAIEQQMKNVSKEIEGLRKSAP